LAAIILGQLIMIYTNKFWVKAGLGLFFLFALSLTSSDNVAHATCIIIYIGKGEILIGADSRNVTKGHNSDSLQYLTTCKIQRLDNIFFVMSGFTNSESYDFNPYKIAATHFSSSENFNSKLSKFKTDVKGRLAEILNKIKTNPKSWQMVVTKENRILDVGMIGNINGQFGVYRLGFILTDVATMTIEVQEEMIACTETTDKYTGFGDCDESRNYIVAHLKTESPDSLIVNAIKSQSIATPVTVGEPINLLKVKSDSFEWLINSCCKE
jgi:hypothetical protein